MKLSVRAWLSILTLVFIILLVVLSWHELVRAWELLTRVNLWILSLFIPLVLFSYFCAGEMIFSYLRQKKAIDHVSPLEQVRISLEMNFVNHALPSGGASGVSYMTWRLMKLGVSANKAAMAQAVRFAAGFVSFSTLLALAVLFVTIDGEVNRWMILLSSMLVGLMIGTLAIGIYVIYDLRRLRRVAGWLTRQINSLVAKITFGRKKNLVKKDKVEVFLIDLHDDFLELKRDKKVLWQPFIWGLVFTMVEVAMFFVAFWSLGSIVNPAPILIAYGVATIAGFAVVTPGGSGAYEAIMVGVLATAGLVQGIAIAGVLLARILILVVVVVIGYAFYQHALVKYGKPDSPAQR